MNIPSPAPPIQKSSAVPDDDWHFFDRIYCISLTCRPDRRAAAMTGFEKIGLADRVEFWLVDKHPTDSEQGIYESHMACLRAGLDAGAERIVVFEDDVMFCRFSPRVLRRAVQFMRSSDGWDLFLFGGWINAFKRIGRKSVSKVDYRCAAHAYVVSRAFAERLVQRPWQGVAFDDMLRATGHLRAYACRPFFAYQSGASTDNDLKVNIDTMLRLLGGSRRLQWWNEFSTYHFRGLVVCHVLFVIGVLFAVLHYGGRW